MLTNADKTREGNASGIRVSLNGKPAAGEYYSESRGDAETVEVPRRGLEPLLGTLFRVEREASADRSLTNLGDGMEMEVGR